MSGSLFVQASVKLFQAAESCWSLEKMDAKYNELRLSKDNSTSGNKRILGESMMMNNRLHVHFEYYRSCLKNLYIQIVLTRYKFNLIHTARLVYTHAISKNGVLKVGYFVVCFAMVSKRSSTASK